MAEGVHRLLSARKTPVKLVSPIGNDRFGVLISDSLQSFGMSTEGLIRGPGRTASVLLQLDDRGDLETGVADVDQTRPSSEEVIEAVSQSPVIVAMDGNISTDALTAILSVSSTYLTLFEPTSVARSVKIVDAFARSQRAVDVITPNAFEVDAMHAHAVSLALLSTTPKPELDGSMAAEQREGDETTIRKAASLASLFRGTLLVKSGSRGVTVVRFRPKTGKVHVSHHPAKAIIPTAVLNTTGAGDTFASAVIACMFTRLSSSPHRAVDSLDEEVFWSTAVDLAQDAAILTLQSRDAISDRLDTMSARLIERVERL